ncbi:MAG: SDR family oxidoreductase [Chloroflexota bacterium]
MAHNSTQFLQKYGAWAIVTGASDGIGREIAKNLASRGMNLVLVARREVILNTLATELSDHHRIDTQVIVADLSNTDDVDSVLQQTHHLDVGLLVASAGFGTSGAFLDASLQREQNMLDVNMRAVLTMTHHYGKIFAQRNRGGIILLSSLVAFQGVPQSAHYAATKAYIQTLAEGLHLELAKHGVDVLASAPGPVDSGFAKRANMQMGASLTPETVARETINVLGHKMTVRPGWLSKVLEYSLTLLPRWGRARMMGIVMRGMTQHQQSNAMSIKTTP